MKRMNKSTLILGLISAALAGCDAATTHDVATMIDPALGKRFPKPVDQPMAAEMAATLSGSATPSAPPPPLAPELKAIWDDPTFQKQFVGAYGINAELEPRITPEESAVIEKLRPIITEDLVRGEQALLAEMKPDGSAMFDMMLGNIRAQRDEIEPAMASYRQAVTKFPSFRRAWGRLGTMYMRVGKYDEAIDAFTRMIQLGGGDAASYGLLGQAYYFKQDYQAAEVSYRNALLLQPDFTEWRVRLTDCVMKEGKYEDAAALLDVLIAKYPDQAQLWINQAGNYLNMKKPLKAAETLEILDKLGKSNADSLFTLAEIYVNENLADLAAGAYIRAIAADVNQPIARPFRGAETLSARGAAPQSRRVIAEIHRVWDQKLDDMDRRKLLKLEARLSMAEGGSNQEAVKVLEEIVKLDPLDGEALMLLARHYSTSNQPDRAIFYYERAESIEAFEINARIGHSHVLVGMGRFSDAIPLLRRVQEIRPRDDIARYLEQVDRAAKAKAASTTR